MESEAKHMDVVRSIDPPGRYSQFLNETQSYQNYVGKHRLGIFWSLQRRVR